MKRERQSSRLEHGRQWAHSRIEQIKPALQNASCAVREQLRSKPAMYAGIAAGLGLAAGITGRIVRRRRLREIPAMVILEAC